MINTAENYVFGRPSVFKSSYCDEIVELRGSGLTVVEVAVRWGVTRSVVYEWCKQNKDFYDAFTRAKDAWWGWYMQTGRQNLQDVQEKGSGTRFNERLYKFLAFASEGVTENPAALKISLDPAYYNKQSSVEVKQLILDEALASKKIPIAVYESLSKTLSLQFERENARALIEAKQYLEELEKKNNAIY